MSFRNQKILQDLKKDPDFLHLEFQACEEGWTCRILFERKQTLWATAKDKEDAFFRAVCDLVL